MFTLSNLRFLLILDSFRAHLVGPVKHQLVIKKKNANLAVIPDDVTS